MTRKRVANATLIICFKEFPHTDFVALGEEVVGSLTPGQALIGVVNRELTALMGGTAQPLSFATQPPAVFLLAGLPAIAYAQWLALAAIVVQQDEEDVDHQSLLEIALADGQSMFTFQTSGSKAVDYWHRLRETSSKAAKTSQDGKALPLTPVILGTDQSFELLMEHLGDLSEEPPASTQALIAQANNIDCQNWLAERLERFVCPTGEWPSAIKVGLVAEPDLFELQDLPLAINNWDQWSVPQDQADEVRRVCQRWVTPTPAR